MKTLCIGEMLVDFFPGGEKDSYIRRAGGAPANVAVALARQGCEASFCGVLGEDDFGRFLLKTLEENGVRPCIRTLTAEATTTMAFVSLDAHGERSFTFARKPGADMLLRKEQVRDEELEAAGLIHAGSCSLSAAPAAEATIYALEEGRRRGKLVSFDLNYRSVMWNGDQAAAVRAVEGVLPFVDLLKISQEEADMVGGEEELPALAAERGLALVVETLGSGGARCFWRGETITVEGLRADCVDTCGAGDAFWGSFLAGLILAGVRRREDIQPKILLSALRRGNVAGWLCVQKKGAIESLPASREVEAQMARLYGGAQ